jgi:signal transduction histidine kinase
MLVTMTTPRLREFARRKPVAIVLSLAFILAVGWLDYATGRDILILPFYLPAICWTSWVAGRRTGLSLAVVGALVWLLADMEVGQAHPHREISYWNALMLLAINLLVVYLVTAFHDAQVHLEETVAQRTAALRHEIAERKRLEAAKIQSERLAAVGSMAAKLAHEIRNPLGTIKLNLDLLGDELGALGPGSSTTTDEAKTLLQSVHSEAHRMQHLAEDYLQFSRVPKLNRERITLNDLLAREIKFVMPTLDAAHVVLVTEFDPALPAIQADPDQLWQAILNLIRNAIEAIPDAGTLTLRTANVAGEIVLRVTDTGRGMNEEQRSHIFKPFFTTKPSGTGLGLTLVQQIIFEHGGRIECASVAGQGTTFSVYFPPSAETLPQHES